MKVRKEYYFKKDTFDRVTAELPIRLLVGHKGTGKSALFKIALTEEKEKGNLPILIKPDDIAELGKDNENLQNLAKHLSLVFPIVEFHTFK